MAQVITIFAVAEANVATWPQILVVAGFLPVFAYGYLRITRGWGHSAERFAKNPHAYDINRRLAYCALPALLGWTSGFLGLVGVRLFLDTGMNVFVLLGGVFLMLFLLNGAWTAKEFLRPSRRRSEPIWVRKVHPHT